MKDESARYLLIDSSCFNKIIYKIIKSGLFNYEHEISDLFNACDIFEKNNVPDEYRKIIVKINLPFTLGYEAEEYITGFPFDITSGKIVKENDKKIITVSNYSYLNKAIINEISFRTELIYFNFDDVKDFLSKLDENGLLNLYIKSVEDFFGTHINLDLNYNEFVQDKKLYKNKKKYRKK